MCTVRLEKLEKNRPRFVVWGDRINYPGKVGTLTAEMLVTKLLFASVVSVVSSKSAQFMTMDISNFYLMAPLERPEYVRVSFHDILDKIIKEYK